MIVAMNSAMRLARWDCVIDRLRYSAVNPVSGYRQAD
jgi:hypothetical protein